MQRYLEAVLGKTKEHATVLIGPYGKGKSHLLLVLLSILSLDLPTSVFEKINKTGENTAEQVLQIQQENKKYLPVLVSSISGFSMNQILLFALREALEKNGLADIAPEAARSLKTMPAGYETTGIFYRGYDVYIKPYRTYLFFYVVDEDEKTVTILRGLQDGMNWRYIINRWIKENR